MKNYTKKYLTGYVTYMHLTKDMEQFNMSICVVFCGTVHTLVQSNIQVYWCIAGQWVKYQIS
jgi:hypothetical protein